MEKLYEGIDIHKEKLAGCIMDRDVKQLPGNTVFHPQKRQ
jgi:hypothetical protein